MMAHKPYEVFDHTADIGLNIFGSTLPLLFIHAAQGMQSVMVAPEQVHVVTSQRIDVEGQDLVSLLITWLNELVFLFDTEYLLFRDFEIELLTATHVVGTAFGEMYDRTRHDLGSAVKAATWHEASVVPIDDGYQARIILDL